MTFDDPTSATETGLGSVDPADIDEWMVRESDETIVWAGGPRIQKVIPAAVASVAIVVGAAATAVSVGDSFVGLLGLTGFLPVLWSYLRVTNTAFVISDRALYRKTGILSRRVRRVSLEHVQNSTFSQGITGSLFGYGTVSVEVAGGGGIRFESVNNPQDIRDRIDSRLGGDEIPGTLEQWTAVLDEARALRAALE
ncbi:hypothetical protein C440_13394 [Haloferax mucosum ATCC BAA-1512]|uniref:YdbS-like PH domain-containing protein n=1 Tax=Haloferax mucosum ATCC BAA-1512 TaxID=662479 RepID=M0I3H6_9EURY|nr:PH domain-containing protein [Haloferax mucosum]ELZ91311.1 hypothetical protein C440_13394 [Haloferax mucosum ATCC BAA-1512]